jgi:hypothetical protein
MVKMSIKDEIDKKKKKKPYQPNSSPKLGLKLKYVRIIPT